MSPFKILFLNSVYFYKYELELKNVENEFVYIIKKYHNIYEFCKDLN